MVRQVFGVLAIAGLTFGALACSGAGGGKAEVPAASAATATTSGEIAQIDRARCGSCHVRVEPGERSRAELETAFTRHRRRVRLSEDQWGEMVHDLAVK